MNEYQSSRRCSLCAINWPDTDEYRICPACLDGDGTDRCRDVKPLDDDEAQSMKVHLEFDRYYEQWDSDHAPERLVPDADKIYQASAR